MVGKRGMGKNWYEISQFGELFILMLIAFSKILNLKEANSRKVFASLLRRSATWK